MGSRLEARLKALEALHPPARGRWHRIIRQADQTQEEAIAAYGREKIGPDDHLIVRRVVVPLARPYQKESAQ